MKLEVIDSDEQWLPVEVDMCAGPGEFVGLQYEEISYRIIL